jgi:UDPglucose 6-dehydrogenase
MMKQRLRSLKGKTIGVWGLAFKPRTDDMREAPAITIIEGLLKAGAIVQAYDPEAQATAKRIFGDRITYCRNAYEALKDADALALITEWNEFREPDFERMRKRMKTPVIFDGRNIYKPEAIAAQGFAYYSIGR